VSVLSVAVLADYGLTPRLQVCSAARRCHRGEYGRTELAHAGNPWRRRTRITATYPVFWTPPKTRSSRVGMFTFGMRFGVEPFAPVAPKRPNNSQRRTPRPEPAFGDRCLKPPKIG
jgi:hypothetical protein